MQYRGFVSLLWAIIAITATDSIESMAIDWEKYSKIVFIDSNIALECSALENLPWKEIDRTGSILILVTSTVLQEVDSKKNNPRLGNHARNFNKTLRPLVSGSDTVVIRNSPAPQVEIALADCPTIDWSSFPDLERDEPDTKVAVQALCARGPDVAKKILISQDIRPLSIARNIGLKVHHIGENWLRPKEISEAEKKVAALQKEINSLKNKEPILEIEFDDYPSELDTVRLRELSEDEREDIKQRIFRLNPMPEQDRSAIGLVLNQDYSISERYQKWMNKMIPDFVTKYERRAEMNYGQVGIQIKIKNVGQVTAEGLLIRVNSIGGYLNEKHTFSSPSGPSAPRLRGFEYHNRHLHNSNFRVPKQPGPHEFVVIEKPARSNQSQVSCQDFRHGYEHVYSLILWVDPHGQGCTVDVTITASNLHGEVCAQMKIQPKVRDVTVVEIIDLETMRFRESIPAIEVMKESVSRKDYSAFEVIDMNWDN